jgi:katanin p60 ATPase-containing subunit A1
VHPRKSDAVKAYPRVDDCCSFLSFALSSEHIFVLAASNLPWDLDSALLRRLEKRIYVPLPNEEARKSLLEKYLKLDQTLVVDVTFDFRRFACATEGYSGSDIHLLCKEVAMMPLRGILSRLEAMPRKDSNRSSVANAGSKMDKFVNDLKREYPILTKDMERALHCTKPSVDQTLRGRYVCWTTSFGSG